jgi:hypothetical protein
VIGLAVTRSGLPVRCWVWPGNTADVTRVEEVKQDLVAWKLGRVVTVVDRGFVSEENLRVLRRAGGHYIAGERWTYPALVDRVTLTDSGFADHLLSNSSGDRYPRAECRRLRL